MLIRRFYDFGIKCTPITRKYFLGLRRIFRSAHQVLC